MDRKTELRRHTQERMSYMPSTEQIPAAQPRLHPELMVQVCRALNFDPDDFAKRHADEFIHLYLRVDGMLSYVGEEIVFYLANRVNECLSKAEYALLSYIEYAGRAEKKADSDCFSDAVARYLQIRQNVGDGWVYAFEGNESKSRCLETYPQMYVIAHAMYDFSQEIQELKQVARTDGPDAWPNPKKIKL